MSLDIRSHWAQVSNVHLKIVAVVLSAAGITNLIVGVVGAVLALAVLSGALKTSGALSLFGGVFMGALSIPLALISILYVFCGIGIIRHNPVARYGSMALCLLLAPFSMVLGFTVSPSLFVELFAAVFVFSLYLLGVLIWMWERRDNTSDLSLLKLGP
jgi:hypothetical protein